jgi:hypothetical protein
MGSVVVNSEPHELSEESDEYLNLSIEQTNGEKSLNFLVFPIPARHEIVIETTQLVEGLKIEFTNMDGRLIKTEDMKSQQKTFSLDSFESGTYMVNFIIKNTKVGQKKFIKM